MIIMKKLTKLFCVATILLGFAANAFGQVSATATATATILTPIAITKTVDLNFGNLAVHPTTAGTLALATDNNRSITGGVTLMPAGTVSAASFTVTGNTNAIYTITLPGSIVITDGTHNMTVNAFTSTPATTGTLTLGTSTLRVGATLVVPGGQSAGIYTNTTDLDVTVNYQ